MTTAATRWAELAELLEIDQYDAQYVESEDTIDLPTGREVRRTRRGTWEVQPKGDNYWREFADLLDAVRCGVGR
jgi:hypothetical protein